MIEALRTKSMDEFKRRFRSVDALLIDDIQFFAGKDTTQEEFFHTFNALFESKQQIILTCDRYPKEVDKLEPRLKSRLGWGLSVAIEPPDFETRAAILLAKAHDKGVAVSENVAMLLAKRIRSNVRDLEGALNTLAARANFYGKPITTDFAEETLRDLLATHAQADHDAEHPEDRGRLLSACACRICCPSAGCVRWRGRARSRCRCPRS